MRCLLKTNSSLDLCASNTSKEIRFILSTHELTKGVFYTYIPRKRFVLDSNKNAISSNVFSRIFEAQNTTLGMKLICPDFISKHLENLTGPSVSTRSFEGLVLDNKVCLSLA